MGGGAAGAAAELVKTSGATAVRAPTEEKGVDAPMAVEEEGRISGEDTWVRGVVPTEWRPGAVAEAWPSGAKVGTEARTAKPEAGVADGVPRRCSRRRPARSTPLRRCVETARHVRAWCGRDWKRARRRKLRRLPRALESLPVLYS